MYYESDFQNRPPIASKFVYRGKSSRFKDRHRPGSTINQSAINFYDLTPGRKSPHRTLPSPLQTKSHSHLPGVDANNSPPDPQNFVGGPSGRDSVPRKTVLYPYSLPFSRRRHVHRQVLETPNIRKSRVPARTSAKLSSQFITSTPPGCSIILVRFAFGKCCPQIVGGRGDI